MSEREPPKWGPGDPIPWDPTPWPGPIVDYMPWWWRLVPRPHPGDPIGLVKFIEKMNPEDLVAIQRIQLVAMREMLNAQIDIQLKVLEQQRDILSRYK